MTLMPLHHRSIRFCEWSLPATYENCAIGYAVLSPCQLWRILTSVLQADAAAFGRRSMFVRAVLELWGMGKSWVEVKSNLLEQEKKRSDEVEQLAIGEDYTWRGTVEGFGLNFTMRQKLGLIDFFRESTFIQEGNVNLSKPKHSWWFFDSSSKEVLINDKKPIDCQAYGGSKVFGREIAVGECRKRVSRLELKSRAFIGPTSMDAELSLIIANMGLARKGNRHLVLIVLLFVLFNAWLGGVS